MSQGAQQSETFSQINMNAIKNTKLFQKFMQNKSGIIPAANGNPSMANKSLEPKNQYVEERKQQPQQRKMQVNLKKDSTHKSNSQQLQNDINSLNFYQEQYLTSKPNKHYQQPQEYAQKKPSMNRSPRPNREHYEQSIAEPYYQKPKPQDAETSYTRAKQYQQEQEAMRMDQNFTVPEPAQNVPQKRKRNFNAYTNKNEISEAQRNVSPVEQSYGTSAVNHHVYSQAIHEGGVGRAINYEQKQTKVQSSPGRSNAYPHSYQIPQQKPLAQKFQSEPFVSHPAPTYSTSPQYSEQEYRQKYDQVQKKYDQLRLEVKNESKHRKQEFSEWEHEIQMLKQKLFDVQSREDSLLIQSQRLKQKCETQNLTKMKTQQQNKELTFRIKQLEDQLHMKESSLKNKADETTYWKVQVDSMKQELNMVRLGLQKKIDDYNLLYGDYQIVKKERDNKDYLLDDLRKNITSLVEENSLTKDQIFKLVTKLYQMEQENQVLRNDLKRQQLDTSQIHSYMKDLQQTHQISRDRVQSSFVERQKPHNIYEPHVNSMERSIGYQRNEQTGYRNEGQQQNRELGGNRGSLTEPEKLMNDKPARRRGEFARERGQLKPDRDERPLAVRQQQQQRSMGQERTLPSNSNQPQPSKGSQFVQSTSKVSRMQQISQQLQKIKDMKAMNGAIRRKKIDLERELQELEDKMNS